MILMDVCSGMERRCSEITVKGERDLPLNLREGDDDEKMKGPRMQGCRIKGEGDIRPSIRGWIRGEVPYC